MVLLGIGIGKRKDALRPMPGLHMQESINGYAKCGEGVNPCGSAKQSESVVQKGVWAAALIGSEMRRI